MSNTANIQELRDKLADIKYETQQVLDRLDSIEARTEEAITPEVFEQKLLNVFKAGLMQGRKEQYDEIYDHFRYNTKYVDFYAGNLNICGDIDLDDFGITGMCEDCCMEAEWADFTVDMAAVDSALKLFKPEKSTTDESNTETSES